MKGKSTVASLISGSGNPGPFFSGKNLLCHTNRRFKENYKLVFVNN
jgi:hypothetical protein